MYLESKRKVGYRKSIGGRLRRPEKAKSGNLWDWVKSKQRDRRCFHMGRYGKVNI